jgi:uncharacterized protein YcsI (UPF0317 family)
LEHPPPASSGASGLAHASGRDVRQAIRSGQWRGLTQGLALGYVQANLAVVRQEYAGEMQEFCRLNPKPCPLLDVTQPGNPEPARVAPGGDVRTDLSRYRLYRDGVLADELADIRGLWRDDHVAFLIGCSLSLDDVLLGADIPMRHLTMPGARNAVYISGIPCRPAGRLEGPMVVSMRPIKTRLVSRAIEVTSHYPAAHGAPLATGDPSQLGIADLSRPDWGKFDPLADDETPVYWGCGVTPQSIAMACKLPEMITHTMGHMFVTDLLLRDCADKPAYLP